MYYTKIKLHSRISHRFMYHGTSSTFLKSILKKGLTDTKDGNKVYPSGTDIASLPGVYLTTNFMTAYSSASAARRKFNGNQLIIVADINYKSPKIAIDEDLISGVLKPRYDSTVMYALQDPKKEIINKHVGLIVKQLLKLLDKDKNNLKRGRLTIKNNLKLIKDTISNSYNLYVYKQLNEPGAYYYKDSMNAPPAYMYDFDKKKPTHTYQEYLIIFKPYLVAFTDLVGKLLKGYYVDEDLDSNFTDYRNVRVPNVGFTGNNKIVSMFELIHDKEGNTMVYVVYHKNESAFEQALDEYRKVVGPIKEISTGK